MLKLIQMEKNMKVFFMMDILKEMEFYADKVNWKVFGKKVKKMENQKKLYLMGIFMK